MENQTKKRHGCLTAWLTLMIIANAGVSLLYGVGGEEMQRMADIPGWAIPVLVGAGIFNVVCAFALFCWKMWGFWGFAASAVAIAVVNLSIGLNPVSALSGLVGVAILYGVLQIGNENKGWPQLEWAAGGGGGLQVGKRVCVKRGEGKGRYGTVVESAAGRSFCRTRKGTRPRFPNRNSSRPVASDPVARRAPCPSRGERFANRLAFCNRKPGPDLRESLP